MKHECAFALHLSTCFFQYWRCKELFQVIRARESTRICVEQWKRENMSRKRKKRRKKGPHEPHMLHNPMKHIFAIDAHSMRNTLTQPHARRKAKHTYHCFDDQHCALQSTQFRLAGQRIALHSFYILFGRSMRSVIMNNINNRTWYFLCDFCQAETLSERRMRIHS